MESLVVDASKSIAQANRSAESQANRKRIDHVFEVGDKVLLSTKHFTPPAYQGRKRNLASKFAGPYEVFQVVSPVAVKLSLPSDTKAHPVFHTSMLRPYVPNTTGERTSPPPEPVSVDGFEEYEVEQILAQRRSRNQTQYLVKWKNYPVSDASWEPRSNLEGNEALQVSECQ
jgi:Chromo (CHRromatin Organisation MOdifier) domain